jgi:hypothetical protein
MAPPYAQNTMSALRLICASGGRLALRWFAKQSNTSMAPVLLHLLGTYSALSGVITCNQCSALAPCPAWYARC